MARQFQLPAQLPPVSLLNPAADAGGRTSSYRSLKEAHKAYIIAYITQGNAATIALTPLQAQDNSGTGSKAIPAVPIWANEDDTTDGNTKQASAASYTTGAGTKNKRVIFEIDPILLDVANGFSYIALQTGASNAANITSAQLFILERYQQATPPSHY